MINLRTHWIRRGLFGAYVLSAGFLLAHSVNAFVEHSLSTDRPAPLLDSVPARPETHAGDPRALAQSILHARLFSVPADVDPTTGLKAVTPTGPPLDVAKKFRLLGTAVNSASGGLVILEELSSQKQTLHHLHDRIPPVGTIAQIEKSRVLFKEQHREEWLSLSIEELHAGFEPRFAAAATPAPSPAVVTKVASVSPSRRKRIERQLLVDADNDSSRLYIHGIPAVFMVDGRSQGIRLDAVNFFGFYGTLGLRTGDVLKRVNGTELQDPTRLPSLVHGLKDERTFTVDLLRNGVPLTLTYDVG